MTDIDWSKAPKRHPLWLEFKLAEHCSYSGWYRKDGEYFKGHFGAHWPSCREGQFFDVFKEEEKSLILDGYLPPLKTTQSAAWNGEGLPPVGIDLQWFSPTYGWIGGKVVAHDGQTIIVRHNDGYEGCYLHNVKLCRTPEQIAADERAATIKRLAALCPQPRADFTGAVIEALIDAGMIKDDAQ